MASLLRNLRKQTTNQLLAAADTGNEDLVVKLLAQGVDVNCTDSQGNTALHLAAFSGHDIIVSLLIQAKLKIDIRNKAGATALKLAALVNKTEVVKVLVAAGAQVQQPDEEGYTALHFAAGMGNLEVVRYLVEDCNSNIHLKNRDGHTPIFCACFAGKESVIRYFANQHPATIRPRNLQGDTLLHCACTVQNPESLVRLLLGLGVKATTLNKRGQTPLDSAEAMMHKTGRDLTGVLQILEDAARQETDVEDTEPDEPPHSLTVAGLLRASARGDLAEMQVYFQYGFTATSHDEENVTPLHEVCHVGYEDIVKELLELKADPNAVTTNGDTPLLLAAAEGHAGVLPLLVTAGADPNARDAQGSTPLHLAAAEGWLETVKMLVSTLASSHEVDTLAEDDEGWTPLLRAVAAGHINVVSFLVNNDTDSLRVADQNGDTALHHACRGGPALEAIAKVLLEAGAQTWLGNEAEETPLMLAHSTGCSRFLINLLQKNEEMEQAGHVSNAAAAALELQNANAIADFPDASVTSATEGQRSLSAAEAQRQAQAAAIKKAEEARARFQQGKPEAESGAGASGTGSVSGSVPASARREEPKGATKNYVQEQHAAVLGANLQPKPTNIGGRYSAPASSAIPPAGAAPAAAAAPGGAANRYKRIGSSTSAAAKEATAVHAPLSESVSSGDKSVPASARSATDDSVKKPLANRYSRPSKT
mmetsp:Transcript_22624/g.52708  ORF Transcript_22624/g.52708 Transcript_22624/m.52708 type:complete len:707 (-) Transcript_22624:227-2347(-)